MTLPEAVVASLLAVYPQVCAELSEHFPAPVAQEIAKYALVRRAFEDGWTRPPNVSVPGLGTGKAVREKIDLARKNRELQVYTVVGEEERRFIAMYGPDAHIISTVAVGLTFNSIGELSHPNVWQWKRDGDLSDPLKRGNFLDSLRQINLSYGPGGEMLNRAVEEIWGAKN
jgi:hypothetical protein